MADLPEPFASIIAEVTAHDDALFAAFPTVLAFDRKHVPGEFYPAAVDDAKTVFVRITEHAPGVRSRVQWRLVD